LRLLLEPENLLVVELTIAAAMLEIIGIGDVSLNVGEYALVELFGDMGLICGIAGIPGTFNVETI
jgi:hypothetical protein